MNARFSTILKAIDKLECSVGSGRSYVVWASCVIPESDEPITANVIDRWLQDGTAERGTPSHVVHYHGGIGRLSMNEWQAKYGPGAMTA